MVVIPVRSPAGLSDVLPNVKPYVPRIGKVGHKRLTLCADTLVFTLVLSDLSRGSQSWWGGHSA